MAVWYSLADKVLQYFDAEAAHGLALRALKSGLVPNDRKLDDPRLGVELWGRRLSTPTGPAPGFRNHAELPAGFVGLGFGRGGGRAGRVQLGAHVSATRHSRARGVGRVSRRCHGRLRLGVAGCGLVAWIWLSSAQRFDRRSPAQQ